MSLKSIPHQRSDIVEDFFIARTHRIDSVKLVLRAAHLLLGRLLWLCVNQLLTNSLFLTESLFPCPISTMEEDGDVTWAVIGSAGSVAPDSGRILTAMVI